MEPDGAGALIRRARRDARLSQRELGERAGVAQSVISTYENGHRQPSIEMLRKLIEATGHNLVLGLEVLSDRALTLPDTPRGRLLQGRRQQLLDCARLRGASNLRVFGSVARGDDGPDSDLDVLVDLDETVGLFGWVGLQQDLADVLDMPVDAVPACALRERIRDRVLREAIPL